MNTINIAIDFTNGTNRVSGISLITGDYASTKIVFQFDREDGTKVFELKNPSGETRYVGEIVNKSGLYVYEVSLYVGDSKLTSAKGQLPVKQEQVIVGDEVIEPYLPIFDELMQEINTAITETNNLNITITTDASGTKTIEITNKSGQTTDAIIEDLQFHWNGTQLGIKTSSQEQYTYVDLQGPQGPAGAIKMIVVDALPQVGATDTIYLVPITPDTTGNNYAEYVYINGAWELLGKIGVQVDLTDYVKNTDYATSSTGGVIKVAGWARTAMDNGVLTATTTDYSIYSGTANSAFISKGTLENVITGKGLTTKSYVDGLVGDIGTALDTINGEVI